MSMINPGVPDLSAARSVPVHSRRIVCPADVQIAGNGLAMDGCDSHLRIVDMITGDVYYVPLNARQISYLAAGAGELIQLHSPAASAG